jgi:hypothetical protein
LIALEDWLARFVAFDGEFGGLAEGAAERPMIAAAGPDGDDGSVWGPALFQPVPGTVEEGVVLRKLWPTLEVAVI